MGFIAKAEGILQDILPSKAKSRTHAEQRRYRDIRK
jgi:hypothetical protein